MSLSHFARFSRGFALVVVGAVGVACANGDDSETKMASDAGGNDFLMPVTGDGAAPPGDDDRGDDDVAGDDDDDSGTRGRTTDAGGDDDADATIEMDDAAPARDAAVDAAADGAVEAGPDAGSQCGAAGHFAAAATACTDNGGTVCDGAGACTRSITVVRVGNGGAALTSASTAVFLDTFYPTAGMTIASSVALPIAASGANQAFTIGGSATSEGNVTTSADGKYVVLAGYAVAPGTAAVASTDAATVPRAVARVSANGTVDTTTTFASTIYSKDNVRSAASSNGSAFWVTGSSGGMYTIGLGVSGGGTSVASSPANLRFDAIVANQLYATSGTTGFTSVLAIGSGVPTTGGQTATPLAGVTTANPYGFVFFDADATVPGNDTLYIGDATSGLERWTFDGATWTKDTTFVAVTTAVYGVTGWATSSGFVVLVTNGGSVARVDIPGAAPDHATVTTLQTAGSDMAFRGITLAAR